ncbi:hypothetical protein [Gordonia iterans]
MNHYLVEVEIGVDPEAGADRLEAVFDALADAVADLTADDYGPLDADVGMTVAEQTIQLAITLEDDDDERAAQRGLVAARSAVHAAGGPTGGWEKFSVAREPVRVA